MNKPSTRKYKLKVHNEQNINEKCFLNVNMHFLDKSMNHSKIKKKYSICT